MTLVLIVVWVVSFGAGFIPFSFIFGARLINRHASNPERTWPSCIAYTERLGMLKMYSKVGYSIFFYIPMLLITVLSTRIVYIIYLRKIQRHEAMKKKHQKENSQEQKQQKKEKKAVLQLLLIVGSFALGYIPHTDLRYLFGEIMYGGHITDIWDRRLCRTYLEVYMNQEQLDRELYLSPGFPVAPNMDYNRFHRYVDEMLPPESPTLYALRLTSKR
ncbi:unnamed protein product [Clavelina lepadiformis]|uniref:G-protein coupled receptors family 1 profile domain-containing protein n=1 Tax=Clavelina lepadiformis TaxID=159417 RepID=A0ABP0FVC4_CLALP